MKLNKKFILTLLLILAGFSSPGVSQTFEVRDDFKKYFEEYQVEGSFVLYDSNSDKFIFYNREQYKEQFTPASTFKICNTLIGLETGVITDENFVIPWDSVKRNEVWDKDYDLKNAYRNSTVWYYQELARRVGGERMKAWLDSIDYGNADTSGGIDKFWLTGGLRITPEKEIEFLKRVYDNDLPLSQRSIDILKEIMIEKDTLGYVLRGKSGWGTQDSIEIGWFVGYLEVNNNVFYFALCVQTDSENVESKELTDKFIASRRGITYKVLKELLLIPD